MNIPTNKECSGYHSSVQMVSGDMCEYSGYLEAKTGLAVAQTRGGCWDASGPVHLSVQEPDAARSHPGSCNQLPFSHHSWGGEDGGFRMKTQRCTRAWFNVHVKYITSVFHCRWVSVAGVGFPLSPPLSLLFSPPEYNGQFNALYCQRRFIF